MSSISVICAYEHHPSRLPLLVYSLNTLLPQFTSSDELCIVETGPLKYLPKKFRPQVSNLKYLKVFTTCPFNRGWAHNVGALHLSTKEILLFIDADLVFPPHYLERVRDVDAPFVGWEEMRYLTPESTKLLLSGQNARLSFFRRTNPGLLDASGGVLVVPRKIFLEVGGYYEKIRGWAAKITVSGLSFAHTATRFNI